MHLLSRPHIDGPKALVVDELPVAAGPNHARRAPRSESKALLEAKKQVAALPHIGTGQQPPALRRDDRQPGHLHLPHEVYTRSWT